MELLHHTQPVHIQGRCHRPSARCHGGEQFCGPGTAPVTTAATLAHSPCQPRGAAPHAHGPGQGFSTGEMHRFSKHAIPDYSARGSGLFSPRLSDKGMTEANTTIATCGVCPVLSHKYTGHITELHLIGPFLVPEILIYKYRHLIFSKVTLEQKE